MYLFRSRIIRLTSRLHTLPSETEHARSALSKTVSSRMENLQTSILFAGKRLNDLTGYSGIEKLKHQITEQEAEVSACVRRVKEAKAQYKQAITSRSESQREVNELLQRKSTWSPSDLERFTTLFRDDHSAAQHETASQQELTEAEQKVDAARDALNGMILSRYHEEQIWSDKIRRASTWGTWGLMGFNVLLFVLVQLGLEPWKRKRLVGAFEEKVREVVNEGRTVTEESVPEELKSAPEATEIAPIEAQAEEDFLTAADLVHFDHSYQPRAGTSSILSMPISFHHLRLFMADLSRIWADQARQYSIQARSLLGRLLSDEMVTIRYEDMSGLCLLSVLSGFLIGLVVN